MSKQTDDERSLADTAEVATHSPKTFDFAAFAAGIRPARGFVQIYSRLDLLADREALEARIVEARAAKDAAEVKRLQADLDAVVTEMTAPGNVLELVVEARSSEARAKLAENLKAEGVEDGVPATLRIIHEHIVEPEGLPLSVLESMAVALEAQVLGLSEKIREVNATSVAVGPDFLRGRSGTTRK